MNGSCCRVDPARVHERAHGQDEARRIAAGIRNALGGANAPALDRVQFRQAIGPVRIDAMGRARVQHPYPRALDKGDGFAGVGIGQTQHDGVGFVQ